MQNVNVITQLIKLIVFSLFIIRFKYYKISIYNLKRTDLRGMNLEGANLTDADLKGAIFKEEDLIRTNLTVKQLRKEIIRDHEILL